MKVLFNNRQDVFTCWGGDTTQMVETRNSLIKRGVDVEVCLDGTAVLTDFDLVHIFNVQNPLHGLNQVRAACLAGIPVALSPIYWQLKHIPFDDHMIMFSASPFVRFASQFGVRLAKALLLCQQSAGFITRRNAQVTKWHVSEMLESADVILPNSHAELEILVAEFGMPNLRAKALIVPNAVCPVTKNDNVLATALRERAKLPERYVLQAGRIEPLKGQLKVIQSLLDVPDIPLVFVGHPLNDVYAAECLRLGRLRGNTWFLGVVPHNDMPAVYGCAKVHVLPSLRESPGLATLEAAVAGANCVVSIHGPVSEYFGRDVWYCDPSSLDSIRNSILYAWNAPTSSRLAERVLREYTWDLAAERTIEAYNQIGKSL